MFEQLPGRGLAFFLAGIMLLLSALG